MPRILLLVDLLFQYCILETALQVGGGGVGNSGGVLQVTVITLLHSLISACPPKCFVLGGVEGRSSVVLPLAVGRLGGGSPL